MLNIIGEYAVTADGRPVGTLSVTQNGLMTVFECSCRYDSPDVLRLAVISSGSYIPVGVVIPESDVLKLKKSMSKNTLSTLGITAIEGATLIRPGDINSKQAVPPASEIKAPDISEANREPQEPLRYNEPEPEGEPEMKIFQTPAIPADTSNEHSGFSYEFPDQFHTPAINDNINDSIEITDIMENPKSEDEFIPDDLNIQAEQFHNIDYEKLDNLKTKSEENIEIEEKQKFDTEPEMDTAKDFDKFNIELEPEIKNTTWRTIEDPSALFSDNEIAEISRSVAGALTKDDGDMTLLAVPLSSKKPFPMMPIFCFGSAETINDSNYIVFKIKDGNLSV